MSNIGKQTESEVTRHIDERTGAVVWQITDHPSINHNLYFLTSSFLPDERSLVFAGFRSGSAQFYRAGFPQGPIVQLTDQPDVNSFSALLNASGTELFYTRGSAIAAVDLTDLSERPIAELPGGKLGEVDLSSNEMWLVAAMRYGDKNAIVVAATDGSGAQIIHEQERTIIHPQFHPTDPDMIEYAADPAPRMYLIHRDGSANHCLYEHGNDEFVVHETWLGKTGDLVFTIWPKALMRMCVATGEISTVANFNAWHICPSQDGTIVLCDTNHPDVGIQRVNVAQGTRETICMPGSSNRGSQWAKSRYALPADFEKAARAGGSDRKRELSWMEMKVDRVYGPQWTHPHPALSRSCRYATFTSDRTGHPQVYVVELPT